MTLDEIIIEKAAQNRLKVRNIAQEVFGKKTEELTPQDLEYEYHQGKHNTYVEILTAFLGETNPYTARMLIQNRVKEIQ